MREFYCPGSFLFDKTKNPFLVYNCKWLTSNEYLIESSTLPSNSNLDNSQVIIKNDQTLLYKKQNKLFIYFVAPENLMEKAVGFFDYHGKDQNLVKNKYWLDMTIIYL